MNKRLFLAIKVPNQTSDYLSDFIHAPLFQESLKGVRYRFIAKEKYHITVSFLGDIPEKYIFELSQNISEICRSFSPFQVLFSTFSAAPPNRPPTMIWAEFENDRTFVTFSLEINIVVKHFLESVDKRIEFRPRDVFVPHVTLMRLKDPIDSLDMSKIIAPELSFSCNNLTLFESKVLPGGASYSEIAVFPLSTNKF